MFYIKQKTIATDVENGEVYHKTIYAPQLSLTVSWILLKDINIELLEMVRVQIGIAPKLLLLLGEVQKHVCTLRRSILNSL